MPPTDLLKQKKPRNLLAEPRGNVLHSVGQGMHLGLTDEASGGVAATIEAVRHAPTIPSRMMRHGVMPNDFDIQAHREQMAVADEAAGNAYTGVRDLVRSDTNEFAERNPKTAMAAEVTGALATGGVGATRAMVGGNLTRQATKAGAVIGGVAGAGHSEGETLEEVAWDAGTGALVGGAVGGGFTAAGQKFARGGGTGAGEVLQDTIQELTQSGYKLPPTHAKPTMFNRLIEGVAGKASTAQGAAQHNQKITNQLARKALGLREKTPLNKETLGRLRSEAGEAYKALKKRSFETDDDFINALAKISDEAEYPIDDMLEPLLKQNLDGREAVKQLKKLGRDKRALYKAFDDPAKLSKARSSEQAEKALEELIERSTSGTMYDDFVAARIQIAKTHQVENALNESTGNVVANKVKGFATGELKTIQKLAQAFPKAGQEITSSMPGLSPLDVFAATGGSFLSGSPYAMGLLFARPAARRAALSQPVQRRLAAPVRRSQGALPKPPRAPALGALPPEYTGRGSTSQ